MSIHFINLTQKSFFSKVPLFKVVPENRICSTIGGASPYLWFLNPEKWKDPFERRFIGVKYQFNGMLHDYPLKGRVFCSCFSLNRVSETQWAIYGGSQNSICLKVNRQKLLDELNNYQKSNPYDDIYIGRVEYQETKTITGSLSKNPLFSKKPFNFNDQESLIKLLLLKRNAYLYEDEIRIFIVKPEVIGKDGIQMNYQCPPTDLVESLTLSPNFSNCRLEQMLSKNTASGGYGFTPFKNKMGKNQIRVNKSHLYNYRHPKFIKI